MLSVAFNWHLTKSSVRDYLGKGKRRGKAQRKRSRRDGGKAGVCVCECVCAVREAGREGGGRKKRKSKDGDKGEEHVKLHREHTGIKGRCAAISCHEGATVVSPTIVEQGFVCGSCGPGTRWHRRRLGSAAVAHARLCI